MTILTEEHLSDKSRKNKTKNRKKTCSTPKSASRKHVKGAWSDEEDQKLRDLVAEYGAKKWSLIAQNLPGRIGKQCRERWYNHLDPTVKKEPWSAAEDNIIIEHHSQYGNQWAQIAKLLPGRPANAIKVWVSPMSTNMLFLEPLEFNTQTSCWKKWHFVQLFQEEKTTKALGFLQEATANCWRWLVRGVSWWNGRRRWG